MAFLEERLAEEAQLNSSYGDAFDVDVVETLVNRYATLNSPYVLSKFSLLFNNRTMASQLSECINLFHRSGGRFGGFRLKHPAEFTTNDYTDTPTAYDSACEYLTDLTWQMAKYYGVWSATCPRRRIKKPVAATEVVGIQGSDLGDYLMVSSNWAVDSTTGIITLDADLSRSITGISKASQAVIGVGGSHGFNTTDSVVIEGVAGMTEINGLRGNVIVAGVSDITVDINSTAFSTYTSVGTASRNPSQTAGEALSCGCEFDIPVAFDMDLSNIAFSEYDILSLGLPLTEIRNPIA